VTREDVMNEALKIVGYLEDAHTSQAYAQKDELEAKILLEKLKAQRETALIEGGHVTGKTIADREREMAIELEADDNYTRQRKTWILSALDRHLLDAKVEANKYQLDIYKAYLGGTSD
jgi:hypothetical protein